MKRFGKKVKKPFFRVVTKIIFFSGFAFFVLFSFGFNFETGKGVGRNFLKFTMTMVKILPPVFILVGLFDVWVKRETIENHLGKGGGMKSFFWVFILAMPMAGGLLPALPVAYALHQKGARPVILLTFLGAVGIGRVPMVLFESAFVGVSFSVIRLVTAIPLVIISSVFLGRYIEKNDKAVVEK